MGVACMWSYINLDLEIRYRFFQGVFSVITLEILIKIVMTCTYQINPDFIKDTCAADMVACIERGVELEDCRGYWLEGK